MIDFYRLFRPRHWSRGHPTNLKWDAFLLDAVKSGGILPVDQYTVLIGGVEVWVGNHPYASFTPYRSSVKVMPTARTVDILTDIILEKVVHDASQKETRE